MADADNMAVRSEACTNVGTHTAQLLSINVPLALVFLLDYYLDSPLY